MQASNRVASSQAAGCLNHHASVFGCGGRRVATQRAPSRAAPARRKLVVEAVSRGAGAAGLPQEMPDLRLPVGNADATRCCGRAGAPPPRVVQRKLAHLRKKMWREAGPPPDLATRMFSERIMYLVRLGGSLNVLGNALLVQQPRPAAACLPWD